MSQKRVKQERRFKRALEKTIGPIMHDAMIEIGDQPEMFAKWVTVAFAARNLAPDLPLTNFLPNQLDETLKKIRPDLEKMLTNKGLKIPQIEDTP